MINVQKLKDIREDKDLTQTDIANILSVPRSTYSMWKIGICIIPLDKLCFLADYYNVSIDYALGLTNNSNSKHIIKGFYIDTLAQNLKKYREKANLTQENIASILKVTQGCVLKYKKLWFVFLSKTCINYAKNIMLLFQKCVVKKNNINNLQ